MPQRRQVLVASASGDSKVAEISRELKQYDIVTTACEPLPEDTARAKEQAAELLSTREADLWTKAIFRESTTVHLAPDGGLAAFSPETPLAPKPLPDGTPVIIASVLTVYMLPPDAEAEMREMKVMQQRGALHTHPIATAGDTGESTASAPPVAMPQHVEVTRQHVDKGLKLDKGEAAASELRVQTFSHAVEAYVDLSRRRELAGGTTVFGWDDVLVLVQSSCTYQELLPRGLKYSPRDVNVARWVMDQIWYKRRKVTNFINERSGSFNQTVPSM